MGSEFYCDLDVGFSDRHSLLQIGLPSSSERFAVSTLGKGEARGRNEKTAVTSAVDAI
jgi:hypothetical protein